MEKKYQIIYIWSFLIISGIILLLLYTPLGGDLHYAAYNEQGRYNVAPGVNYSSQIGGFSGGSSSGGSYNYSPTVSAYKSTTYNVVGTGANYSSATNFGSSASYSGGGGIALSNKSISGSGGSGGSGMMAVGGGSRGSSNGGSNNFSGGGVLGGSLFNSTTLADGGVMQKGTQGTEGPLDPGNEPLEDPLPIGDELGILMLLVSLFTFYKWLHISKK